MCQLPSGFRLTALHRNLVLTEWADWHAHYLPVPPGCTVLDVGAGCGETAYLYLQHGASRVVCVEGDPDAYACLCRNPTGAVAMARLVPTPWTPAGWRRTDAI